MKKVVFAVVVAVGLLARVAPTRAQGEPEPTVRKHVGVGFKIGNGMGFVGGDVLISPIDHLTLDLQANYLSTNTSGGTATGYGFAPTVQGHLFAGQRSSPYLGVGMLYATLTLDNVTASASGVVANAGYEWRWSSGVGILLGGGIAYLGNIHASDGVTTVDAPAFTHVNIEAGLRFMFL